MHACCVVTDIEYMLTHIKTHVQLAQSVYLISHFSRQFAICTIIITIVYNENFTYTTDIPPSIKQRKIEQLCLLIKRNRTSCNAI